MTGPFSDILLGVGKDISPTRRRILLKLAIADGQLWSEDQADSGWTDHMAEQMYGAEADIVLAEMATAWDEGQAATIADHGTACHQPYSVRENPYREATS